MFKSKTLTADPKEHLRRTRILLDKNDNSLLAYAALELRFCIERIVHNQLALSDEVSRKIKKGYHPKTKKSEMMSIDPNSNHDYDIYYTDPQSGEKSYWGTYKNIPETKVNSIFGKLGAYLHMKPGLKLGVVDDPWYVETRAFLNETQMYLAERIENSEPYFSYTDLDNYELIKK